MSHLAHSDVELAGGAEAGRISDIVGVGYIALVVVVMFSHNWYVDLTDRNAFANIEAGSLVAQVTFVGLASIAALLMWQLGFARLGFLLKPPLSYFWGWLLLSTLLSAAPLISFRRLTLYFIVLFLAATLLVVARNARLFATGLAVACVVVLAGSYAGVLFLPEYAIHSAFDATGEPEHAGLWRGIFAHKNEAGAAMALIVICGLYVARAINRVLGYAIACAALVFLAFTGSKTPLGVLIIVLAMTSAGELFRSFAVRSVLFVGPFLLLSIATIGSVVYPKIQDVVAALIPDATFTARNEIWSFAIENIAKHPFKGWGFGAFWRTDATMFGSVVDPGSDWVQSATQAHNSMLDAALIMGLPGLPLTLYVFAIMPTLDCQRVSALGGTDPAPLFFTRLWQISLLSASFETILFNPNSAACGLTMLGIFGLRMCTARPIIT